MNIQFLRKTKLKCIFSGKTLLCGEHEGSQEAMNAFKKRVNELDLNRYIAVKYLRLLRYPKR